MAAKLLGMIDLAIVFIILFHSSLPAKLILFAAGYLIVKGVFFIFTGDYASYADAAIGIYMVFMLIGASFTFITAISVVFLAQKGLLSLA